MSKSISQIIDQTTSMTENDVFRLLKGCVRRNMCSQALYCLKVLERGERYFERSLSIIIVLFFELGIANDFPDLMPDLIAITDFAGLREMVVKMCCRGSNHMAFVPDMLARIVGYSEERTLTQLECASHLQFPAFMTEIGTGIKEHGLLAYQTAIATVFNMMETTDLSYLPAWRALRCAHLFLFLVGDDKLLWNAFFQFTVHYRLKRGLGEWVSQCRSLYEKLPSHGLWDKRRSIIASVVCAFIYGIQEKVSLEAPSEEAGSLRPELFPEWFYSTAEAPSNILFRPSLPDSVESYLKKKYPRYGTHWSDLYAEIQKLSAKMSLESNEFSIKHHNAKFAKSLSNGKQFQLPEASPARRLHCFITDGSILTSAANRANPNMLTVRLLKNEMASIMTSSILCYNGPFRNKYGTYLDAALRKNANLELLYGGPFVNTSHIVTMLTQLVLVAYTDLFDAYPQYEPYVQYQINGPEVTLLTVNLCANWKPIDASMLVKNDGGVVQARLMWTLGWIYRYLLEQATYYDPADFVYADEGNGNLVFLWLFGLYPDERAFREEECVSNMMKYSDPELYESCMMTLEALFEEETFNTYLEMVIPKKRTEMAMLRSMVAQRRSELQQRHTQLSLVMPVGGRPIKKQRTS